MQVRGAGHPRPPIPSGRGSLIQRLDFKKGSIKKAEKKVPLGVRGL
jgi:hypothetical protein